VELEWILISKTLLWSEPWFPRSGLLDRKSLQILLFEEEAEM